MFTNWVQPAGSSRFCWVCKSIWAGPAWHYLYVEVCWIYLFFFYTFFELSRINHDFSTKSGWAKAFAKVVPPFSHSFSPIFPLSLRSHVSRSPILRNRTSETSHAKSDNFDPPNFWFKLSRFNPILFLSKLGWTGSTRIHVLIESELKQRIHLCFVQQLVWAGPINFFLPQFGLCQLSPIFLS